MGYYVQYYGDVSFWTAEESGIVQAAKDLNFRHELKGGATWPKTDNPFLNYHFSWLPGDYHENEGLRTVADILELLGFEISRTHTTGNGAVTHEITYDNKMGDEQIFLAAMAHAGAKVDLFFKGEDGVFAHFDTGHGNELVEYPGFVKYDYKAGLNVWDSQVERTSIFNRWAALD